MIKIRQERPGYELGERRGNERFTLRFIRRCKAWWDLHWDPYYWRVIALGIVYIPLMAVILVWALVVAFIDWLGL